MRVLIAIDDDCPPSSSSQVPESLGVVAGSRVRHSRSRKRRPSGPPLTWRPRAGQLRARKMAARRPGLRDM